MHATAATEPARKPERARPKAPPVGVVIFANEKEPSEGGWACVDGGTPFTVTQAADLPSNVLWVTNTDWMEFNAQGYNRIHNLRRVNFFRTPLKQIAADIGLSLDGANASTSIVPLSSVCARAARIADDAYRWRTDPFSTDSLADEIKASMPPDVPPIRILIPQLLAAYQKDSSVRCPWVSDTVYVTLRCNRVQYAQKILSTPIPDDAWEEIPGHLLPESDKDRLEFALNSERPVLAEVMVDVADTDPDEANLVAFGSNFGKRMPIRKWVSHIELLWLARFAHVKIHSLWLSAAYRGLSEAYHLPSILTEDPYIALSYSAGLVAENQLQCLSSDYYTRSSRIPGNNYEVTARAVWLRAADRAQSFLLAKRVVEAGFYVSGYQMGSVMCRARRSDLTKLAEFCLAEGLMSPSIDQMMALYGDGDAPG